MRDTMDIQFNVQMWRDGETNCYIVHVPQLDVFSSGSTPEEARKNIQDAVHGFMETAREMGTLEQILEEAGFSFDKEWKAPEIVAFEQVRLAL